MAQLKLKAHQVWQDLTKILENIDSDALIREHLEACEYKVCGYWDDRDIYYEEIIIPSTIQSDLVSSSIGFTGKERFLQFKFNLNTYVGSLDRLNHQTQKIGELVLTYNENLNFLDERWVLDVDSSGLKVKLHNP